MSANLPLIERMVTLGAHLTRLRPGMKQPTGRGWQIAAAITPAEADEYVNSGGNIGVNLGLSGMIAFDAEDLQATVALVEAGFKLTVAPAKHSYEGVLKPGLDDPSSGKQNAKVGGSHVWLRVPDTIDASQLSSDHSMQLTLPNGGLIDVLAGKKYAVAPPSALELTYGSRYQPFGGGPLDLSPGQTPPDIPDAPAWLFDLTIPCPPGLAPLHGCLIPRVHEQVEQSARSAELSAQIDEISWDQWLAGEHRLTPTGEVDGCGCDIYYWQGSSNNKSCTLHDGCEQGNGVHVWSGTMIAQLGLTQHHLSRLDLAAALRGQSRRSVAGSVGIALGEEREELGSVRPADYEWIAKQAEERGNTSRAAMYREAAAFMASSMPTPEARGETYINEPMIGMEASGSFAQPFTGPIEEAPAPSMEETAPEEGTLPPGDSGNPRDPDSVTATGIGGELRIVGKQRIRSFPGRALEDVPKPVGSELHEYPVPEIPAHVKPVQGAVTPVVPVLPPIANRRNHENVVEEWIFAATPGLSQVAAAADSRAVSRWGMLGALLPRIAAKIPATVRLVPANRAVPTESGPTSSGTSINVYSILVGPPASGKTDTMGAATALIPGVRTLAPGTGEGVLKEFPRADDGDDDDDDTSGIHDGGVPPISNINDGTLSAESLILESDEIDVFVGEMMRQGSKTTGWYRSMWMGGEIGNTASDRDRRSAIAAHTYRFGILLGAQPDALTQMFGEAGRGTPQRFMWLPAQQGVRRGPIYPERLQVAEVHWLSNGPSMIPQMPGQRPPVWIHPPEAAIEFMDEERARASTADPMHPAGRNDDDENDTPLGDAEAIANRHAVLQQLKVSVLLAALDGLTAPQDTHWYAAGAIMEVRRRTIEHLVVAARELALDSNRKRGVEQGVLMATARAASENETFERRQDTQLRVALESSRILDEGRPVTRAELCSVISQGGLGNAAYVADALDSMCSHGILYLTVQGDYIRRPQGPVQEPRIAPVLNLRPDQTPPAAGPPPAPTIGNVVS